MVRRGYALCVKEGNKKLLQFLSKLQPERKQRPRGSCPKLTREIISASLKNLKSKKSNPNP